METSLDARYSEPGTEATPWSETEALLAAAQMFLVVTVRADGRPHAVPLLALWDDGALHLVTGPEEQKHKNFEHSPLVSLTTTSGNAFAEGYDVVVDGTAVRVTDDARLRELAALWPERFGEEWEYDVRDGSFWHQGGPAHVYVVRPDVVRTFTRGPYRQTAYRF